MPSGLFKQSPDGSRWLFSGPTPAGFDVYQGDHASLLVKYMFQISPDEQRRLAGGVSSGSSPPAATTTGTTTGGMARRRGNRAPPLAARSR
jgi:hypothetical protein